MGSEPTEGINNSTPSSLQIVIMETGKKTVSVKAFPVGGYTEGHFLFLLANHSEQGPVLLRVALESNELKVLKLRVRKEDQQRSLVKYCFGITEGNLLFSLLSLNTRAEEMYALSLALLPQLTEAET
jgi:hypothetical protein